MTLDQLIAFKRLSDAREEVIRQARDFVNYEGSVLMLSDAVSELEHAEMQHRNAETQGRRKLVVYDDETVESL